MPNRVRVFIIDTNPINIAGIKVLVTSSPHIEVVGVADSPLAASTHVHAARTAVFLMAYRKAKQLGLDAVRKLQAQVAQRQLTSRLIVQLRDVDLRVVRKLVSENVAGLILDSTNAEGLIHAITTVAAGRNYFDETLSGTMVDELLTKSRRERGQQQNELTSRESEVLRLVAKGHSHREIAALLKISIKTVETHKSRSMTKLDVSTRAEIVRYAVSKGWFD